jgi:hypothetical protein
MTARLVFACWLCALVACEPTVAETALDVDNRIRREDFEGACTGFRAQDAEVRSYTAEALAQVADAPVATACVCAALYDPTSGRVDLEVASALEESKRDDLATCLARAIDDPHVADRAAVAERVADIGAEAGYDALSTVARGSADTDARAAAVTGLRPSARHVPVLVGALTGDAAPGVRAAAAAGLVNRKDAGVAEALVAATGDADPSVRAAAVAALAVLADPAADAAICRALLEDPDEGVRNAGVVAWNGVRRPEPVACLGRRLLKEEPSPTVRSNTLAALAASRTDGSKAALCDAIGPFLRLYVVDKRIEEIPGTEIVATQNAADMDRSYACVERALGQGGYSCFAKHHLGTWMNDLGGKARVSLCPGMAPPVAAGSAPREPQEMSFE